MAAPATARAAFAELNRRLALADLHQLLSQAFLTPVEPEFAAAFLDGLAEDLDDVARELAFDCASAIDAFRESVRAMSAGELLPCYSALFLQPPRRASLDASVHLDGAAMGPTSLAVEEHYARHGLRPSERVRELPDHLSRLLEFSAFLLRRAADARSGPEAQACEREARDFLDRFVRPWLPALALEIRAACEAHGIPRPYQHLAELAAAAAWEGEGWRQDPRQPRRHRTPRQALCRDCQKPYAEAAALKAVRRIMQKKGLATGHLDRCENCRGLTDDVQGMLEPAALRAL